MRKTLGLIVTLAFGIGIWPVGNVGGDGDISSASLGSAAQAVFAVIGVSPSPEATNVPVTTTISVTFNLPLVASSVTTKTFTLTALTGVAGVPVAGTVAVLGPTATFRPLTALLPLTTYQVRIVGGPNGVRGSSQAGSVSLERDFLSTFRTGEAAEGGMTVRARNGGTVTDPRTGASASIPANTLKIDARVRILTLDSPAQIGRVDNSCGVSIRPDELLPGVNGFLRVSEIVRYEVQPCGAVAFGPSMTLRFPLIFPFKGTLPIGTVLRVFQLGRSAEGQLVFRDTAIPARVIGNFLTGTAAIVPAVPVFGTFAAFLPVTNSAKATRSYGGEERSATFPKLSASAANAMRSLYFPLVLEGAGRRTKISVVNPAPTPVDVRFVAYTPAGVEFGNSPVRLDGGRQFSLRVGEAFPGFTRGAIVAVSNEAITGFYEIVNDYDKPTLMAGATGVRSAQAAMVFPVLMTLGNDTTEVHLFNPSPQPVRVSVKGYDATGAPVDVTDGSGSPVADFELPPFGTYVASSRDPSANTGPAFVPLAQLNGGYLIAQSLDANQGLVGGEIFGTETSAQQTVAVVNGLPLPSGCVLMNPGDGSCHVDSSPESEVPEAVRQHTLYGLHFDDPPAAAELLLINVSDQPAQLAISGFREDGSFRGSFPASGFLVPDLPAHRVLRLNLPAALGFHPAPGYIRIEDQNSAFVGVVINYDATSGRYRSVLPLVPDDPRLAQLNVNTFLSRIQLDSSGSPEPRVGTGLIVFNPNNNSVPFTLRIRDNAGRVRSTSATLVARGVFIRLRSAVSFPTTDNGYVEMQTTGALLPGTAARLILVGIYRARGSSGIHASSPVLEQTR